MSMWMWIGVAVLALAIVMFMIKKLRKRKSDKAMITELMNDVGNDFSLKPGEGKGPEKDHPQGKEFGWEKNADKRGQGKDKDKNEE